MYLLDANVPIDANRDYYPIDRVPEFWDWLASLSSVGQIKIPLEIFEEITSGNPDDLIIWLKDRREGFLLFEDSSTASIRRVIEEGYGLDFDELEDQDVAKLGRDPFLIAFALLDPANRVVVSNESSKPSRIGANRHVPDVCESLKIRCITIFQLIRLLDFRTK